MTQEQELNQSQSEQLDQLEEVVMQMTAQFKGGLAGASVEAASQGDMHYSHGELVVLDNLTDEEKIVVQYILDESSARAAGSQSVGNITRVTGGLETIDGLEVYSRIVRVSWALQ